MGGKKTNLIDITLGNINLKETLGIEDLLQQSSGGKKRVSQIVGY